MTMLDRIALAKAGYKKKEIEEMLAAETINNEEPVAEDQEEKKEPEKEPEKEEKEEQENVSDKIQEELLAAFEEQKEEIANLQKQLKEAQTANTRVNMNVESVEDKEQEIIKKLMEG